jgi:sugar lactone lactonase YvrE
VSLEQGRVIRRLQGPSGLVGDILAASPDGRTLYYTYSGAIWAVPAGDGRSEKVRDGHDVVVDPRNGDLIIQLVDKDGVRLIRRTIRRTAAGMEKEKEKEIRVPAGYRLTTDPLSPNAVGRDGRILVEVASPSSWFWRLAILDPGAGTIQMVATPEGDVESPGWTRDGKILARVTAMRSSLWRFKVVTADERR